MLHHNSELFQQAVIETSESFGINTAIVEKDYYVSLFLHALIKRHPQFIFKGGTSLSKCYKLIKRFSEDIDLGVDGIHPTESQRKELNNHIISTIEEFNFALVNSDDIKSRRDYNKYIIDFPSSFETVGLKQHIVVETSVFLKTYPSEKLSATSYIYDYLKKNGRDDIITAYSLEPFELNVQTVERTFLDKLFAIGDYYLAKKLTEHSRHIYDLYKLSNAITFDNSLKQLFYQVKEDRKQRSINYSAQDGIDLQQLLQEIIDKKVYKADYDAITTSLLFEKVSYEEAISGLQKILNSNLFQ